MKRILLCGFVGIIWSGSARAEIPIIDPTGLIQWAKSIEQQVQSYTLQTAQWAKQQQQYVVQGEQYLTEAKQLAGFIHDPNLGAAMGLLNQAGLGSALPVSPYAVQGLVRGVSFTNGMPNINGVLGQLSALSGSSYAANHVYSPTDGSWNSKQLIDNGNAVNAVQGTALASYGTMQTHQADLQPLRDHLIAATTPKDVQDAQAEIDLENLWTANQQASLTAVQIAADAQQQVRVQQDNEAIDKSIDDFLAAAKADGAGL